MKLEYKNIYKINGKEQKEEELSTEQLKQIGAELTRRAMEAIGAVPIT
ncbi:MAG: hypothetical protein MR380_10450 [Lachnospiraceae bacterium]|nr:hypothetical protein [Lachnospiraceae bacterium]